MDFYLEHGGGNRCKIPGCTKSGQDSRTLLCVEHGGRKCAFEGCTKSNQGSGFCLEHGGGRKCAVEGCKHHSLHGGLCRGKLINNR
jgi:hypothetical protein